MSAISRELVQKSSTPMEENSGAGKFSYANRATGMFQPNRSFCKKKKGERNLVKSDSTNSFSSMVVMKPGMMLQSSISSAGNFLVFVFYKPGIKLEFGISCCNITANVF